MKCFRPAVLPSQSSSFRWGWLSLLGPDAKDFLQRLSTASVRSLAPGAGTPGCFLTPQGKVRASFQLWCEADDRISFEFDPSSDGAWKTEILNFIDQYTFSEKMNVVEPDPTWSCIWLFPTDGELSALGWSSLRENQTLQTATGLKVCRQSPSAFGRDWLSVWGTQDQINDWSEENCAKGSDLSEPELNLWRIRQLRPRVGFELSPDVLPLELGMHDAVAQQKGCYPGQEVIERIASLGSPPRRLVRIEATGGIPQLGESVLAEDRKTEIGKVTSVAQTAADRADILALIKKMFVKEGDSVKFSRSPVLIGVQKQATS